MRSSALIKPTSNNRTRRQPSREARYTVGLPPGIATKVQRYARTSNTSMSKALASLVRLGLENQDIRKRVFFQRLRENLATDDPARQDELVDEFRTLILGR